MFSVKRSLLRIFLGMTILVSLSLCLRVSAQAAVSTNVPLDDISYFYMDKLVNQGLVKSDLAATKPFSRFEMARLCAEARTNWDNLTQSEQAKLALIEDILQRLENRYREEIEDITGVKEAATTFFKPADRISALYRYQDGPYAVSNNQGLDFYDKSNAVIDLTMRATIANVVGTFLQPRFVYYGEGDALNAKGNQVDQTNFDFLTYYAKLDYNNIELELGADSLWWSPVHNGALIMSDNAQPFPMAKLSNPLPTFLPWIFASLGPFKYNFVFATLDSNRLNPAYPSPSIVATTYNKPSYAGIHLDFKPRPWFEFGFNYDCIYGGEGTNLSFTDKIRVIFGNSNLGGNLEANSQFSMFWNARFNDIGWLAQTLSFYGEWGGEDKGYPFPDRRAYQLGLLLGDFLKWQGRLQLAVEYANTSPQSVRAAWYTHAEYPATYEGRVFGHHVGTDGEDIYASLSILVSPQLQVQLDGNYEKRRTSLDNGERAMLGQIEAIYSLKENLSLTGSVGLEKVDNAGYVEGATDNRYFLSLQLHHYF